VTAVFFVNGVVLASWFSRIPAVQDGLSLGPGTLGLALLGLAAGAVLSMPTTGWLVSRVGSRPVVKLAALTLCVALLLPALAPSLPLLVGALLIVGLCNGSLDVSMNAHAVSVENLYERPILSSIHGIFSVGGLVGAAVGGLVASVGVEPIAHFLGVALVSIPVLLLAGRWLLPASADSHDQGGGPSIALPNRAVAALGVVAFCVFVGEGAMADWSAVYLRDVLDAGPGVAAAGYAAFSLTMTIARLSGDRLVGRIGPVAAVRAGGAMAAVGLGIALFVGMIPVALAGFACVGLGLAVVFPVAVSAAGRARGVPSGTAIAAVTTMGYFGFLAGPPVIGFAAEIFSLGGALLFVVLLSAIVVALAGTVRPPSNGSGERDS
jgi:MFS family permease